MTKHPRSVSIVIPLHNEEKNVSIVFDAVYTVMAQMPQYKAEIILVNDGSRDTTWKQVQHLVDAVPQGIALRAISFARNFGHQAAIEAGLSATTGDAVIMMDGDLQHPPELIPDLLKKWEEGYQIVNTQRIDSADVSFFKKLTSRAFYSLINGISEINLDPGSADFRLLDRAVVDELNKLPEKNKFYRGLVSWVGFKTTSIEYQARPRLNGTSSYTLRKMLSLAHEGLTSFSMVPLKGIIILGFALTVVGFILSFFMVCHKYLVDIHSFSGPAILASFIILNNGILLTMIGVVSLYQVSMYKEIKNRPNFIIQETI